MLFNISAFTHTGTQQKENQDHILVNEFLLNDGKINLDDLWECFCFVADGVGGNKSGEFASNFVLNELRSIKNSPIDSFESILKQINCKLIELSRDNEEISGTATTLSGITIKNEKLHIIHCGDSQIWLLRDNMFFQITNDHVLDLYIPNSPITNFFGGYEDNFWFDADCSVTDFQINDLFLICSDGLFKSLKQKIVKSILTSQNGLSVKLDKIIENCLAKGAEDNVSAILIKRTG